MRVISGTAKGTPLQTVPGSGTRPVSDRVKEAVFDILGDATLDARVLDLFAGTGSVGIEALSRGAATAVFVETQQKAVTTIRDNLRRTRLEDRARVVKADVFKFLSGLPEPYDLVYVAPPQYEGLWRKALLALDQHHGWLVPTGLVIVQVFPKEFELLELRSLSLADQRRYGSTLVCFYRAMDFSE